MVHTFAHNGNYECGFGVLRFIEAYVCVFCGYTPIADRTKAQDLFDKQLQSFKSGPTLQKIVIAALANELGMFLRSALYKPPYQMFYNNADKESSLEVLSNPT